MNAKSRAAVDRLARRLYELEGGHGTPCACLECRARQALAGEVSSAVRGLDLVPDWVKEFCAEKAKEYVLKQYGQYIPLAVIGGGLLAVLAIRGLTVKSGGGK